MQRSPVVPDEIVKEILTPFFHISEELFASVAWVSPFSTYKLSSSAALLVCKSWNRVGTPLLYDTVILRSKAQAQALAAALKKDGRLATFIKRIRIEGGYGYPVLRHHATLLKSARDTDLRRLTFVDTSTDRREPSLSLRTYLCIELACAISTYWEVLEHFRFAGKEPGLSEGADLVLTEVRKKKIRTLDIREITPLSDSVLDLLRTGPTRHPDSRGKDDDRPLSWEMLEDRELYDMVEFSSDGLGDEDHTDRESNCYVPGLRWALLEVPPLLGRPKIPFESLVEVNPGVACLSAGKSILSRSTKDIAFFPPEHGAESGWTYTSPIPLTCYMLELLVAASPHTLQQLHLTTVQGLIETSNLFRVIDALSRIENLRSLALGDVVLLEKDVPKTMPPVPVGMLSRLERLAIFTEATSALTVLDLLAKVE
ncbi:hypothetical protein CC1G_14469 [Coprinopsis cinerea okayama7|uniref:Uncharacterized protein n=1 Tax=Coprinopsis cinerea (strain Okayama-7 / 130 / ATCC MYA-4618 / FGSC 9003) TaxID=240176 RepID=D6RMC4_COPC7|nr:hypothetical protein CC1G_14469 [Coprinopsis cinerea okayama7\|eukprot:XP_002911471.1 hypothetical protein CC1G_14469 [Coprinopsis cinerea okayama7\